MMTRIVFGLTVLLLVGIASACGSDDPTATPTATAPAEQPTPTFAEEWEALIEEARSEGDLTATFTAGSGSRYQPLIEAFGEKFGIEVTVGLGRASEQGDRLMAEQSAGRYLVDVYASGIGTSTALYEADAFEPFREWLFDPEVKDESNWKNGRFWWGDAEEKYIFIYAVTSNPGSIIINTDLVNPDELQSDLDLLDPKWKGKIVVATNPLTQDMSSSTMTRAYQTEAGRDYMRRLWTEMDVALIDNMKLYIDSIARGTYAIGAAETSGGNPEEEIETAAALGLPIASLELEQGFRIWRTSSGGVITVPKNPPHPATAKLFVNWLLSEDGWADRVQLFADGSLPERELDWRPLHTKRSIDHIVDYLGPTIAPLPPDDEFILPSADPNFSVFLEEGREWLRQAMRDANVTF